MMGSWLPGGMNGLGWILCLGELTARIDGILLGGSLGGGDDGRGERGTHHGFRIEGYQD
jgi:hypothetical protein